MIEITMDHTMTDCRHWKSLLSCFATSGLPFEIHCWKEETDAISLALQYGQRKQSDWHDGVVISGVVTPQFHQMLLDTAKPDDTALYNKQTPFFSIFLGQVFSAEHYGTENYILSAASPACTDLLRQLSQIDGIRVSTL